MKVTYNIPGTLQDTLFVINELKAITGMDPEEILLENNMRIRFNKSDFQKLESGKITEEKYISMNGIS